jgi:AcrR family transcriptional regulator
VTSLDLFSREASNLGKSARTRARLMDAAVDVFARDGFEAASVNEITRAAEVANGTFYVYFKDKDQIASAVAYRIAHDVVQQLDEAMVGVEDAVERISSATRRFLDLASSNPQWGRALFRAVWIYDDLRVNVTRYLRADLERGVAQGVFQAEIDDFLISTFSAMTMAALFQRLNAEEGSDSGSRVAELQLRMLGVAADVAKRVAYQALEPVNLTMLVIPREIERSKKN